jgi:hypothetical protein
MGSLELFLHDTPERTPALAKAALAHVQFETIHPFLDGNGRLGRLLIIPEVAALFSLTGLWILGVMHFGPFQRVLVFDLPLYCAVTAGAGLVTLQFYNRAACCQDEAEILEAQHRARYGVNSFTNQPAPSRTPRAWGLVVLSMAGRAP